MKRSSSAAPARSKADWRAIFGLANPANPGWPRVRAAQIEEIVRLFPILCISNFFHGVAIVTVLFGALPRWHLVGWLVVMLAVIGWTARELERARRDPRGLGEASFNGRPALRMLLLGALWAVPPGLFAAAGSIEQQLAVCLLCAGLFASMTLTTATMPMLTLLFLATGGIGFSALTANAATPLIRALPAVYVAGLALGAISLAHAFVHRKLAEIELRERDEVVRLLLREFEQGGADWLWQIDTAKRLCQVTPGLARAAGMEPASLEGLELLRLLAGDGWRSGDVPAELSVLATQLNDRESFADLEVPVRFGEHVRWWSLSATPRHDEAGLFLGFHGKGSDVTERRLSAEAIDRLARYDGLTGLANRGHLLEMLRKALNHAQRERGRCALLLIDLDKFKPVNDTLGHPIGDRLLRQVADRLRALLHDSEICGRLGGDEFAIVIERLEDAARLVDLGEAVVTALAAPFDIEGNIIRIGASVGGAMGPRDGRAVETLMRNADLALYKAKDEGRGVLRRYEPQMQKVADDRRQMEEALRDAIDSGELSLVYQPIIDLSRDRIEGFEALLRWRNPRFGDVSPGTFMPIAEEARLSARIGEWVLRTACEEAAHWPDPIRVAVNLSTEQLRDPQLNSLILSALSHSGLVPGRLELEISERLFLTNSEMILPVLERLRPIGVRIALDDFGTGYSALGYVRQGRFSSIKIDNSCVHKAAVNDPESVAIIRAVVAMAGSLGIETTAEGTETAAQDRRIRELGCTRVQGRHLSWPVAAADARALVADRQRRAS